jgi:membrane protease YdiL (CAAX protease family)
VNPSPRRRALGAVLFVIGSIFAMLCAGVGAAVLLIASAFSGGAPPPAVAQNVPPGIMGAATLVQFFLMAIVAAAVAWWVGPGVRAFALRNPHPLAWPVAFVGGLTVGVFPGWLASFLMKYLPMLDLGGLGKVSEMIAGATGPELVLVAAGICVAAPVVEELCFRGLLYELFGGDRSPIPAWIGTSVLFAVYHADPVHIVAVMFTGFFLGWLRMRTGSVLPGMLAHAVNNTSATLTLLWFGDDMEATQLGFLASAAFGLATVALAAALLLPRTRPVEAGPWTPPGDAPAPPA